MRWRHGWRNSTSISSSPFIMSKLLYQKYYKEYVQKLHQSTEDDYTKAIATLNLLQTNAKDLKGPQTSRFLRSKLDKLRFFLSICDLPLRNLEKQLSVIHVSGTKGKGSTCAFCESILQTHGFKTGFFSSPHLVSVRERIRIDGNPISRKQFSRYFWDIHGKLQNEENTYKEMPPYFMFLTIMALKIFLEEKVDVAIIEVGIGGEYDYTNVLSNTAVVGISSLGLDHVNILGNTIEEIAYQKSGIMKKGCIAITSSDQPTVALKVLEQRSAEKQCNLFIAPKFSSYSQPGKNIKLGIEGPAQEYNASLAVQLTNAWMNIHQNRTYEGSITNLSKQMLDALGSCSWPGRTQLLKYSSKLTYYLDGAHTVESMQNCVSWFESATSVSGKSCKKILVFNLTSSRDSKPIFELFLPLKFDYVIFCPNKINSSKNNIFEDNANFYSPETDNKKFFGYRKDWLRLHERYDENFIKIFNDASSVHEFLECLSKDEKFDVLVTGSLHLIGTFLTLLDPELKCSYRDR